MQGTRYTAGNIPVHFYKNPAQHGFFLALYVRSGSMYEGEGECGITHFFEHAAIRNVNHSMGGALYPHLDSLGLEFNASTYSEMVQFYLSGNSGAFAPAAEILARLFLPITLPGEELVRERARIRAEIREADEKNTLTGFTAATVWGGTPLARSILGTASSISKITKKRLEEYRRGVFTAENLFVYVTGNFSDGDIDYLLSQLSSVTLYEGKKRDNYAPVPQNFGKRGPLVAIKPARECAVRLSFDLDMASVKSEELDLLYDILLGGYSSALFMELSEKSGLVYDLSGATERYKNIGTFSFFFEVAEADIYTALEVAVAALKELKAKPKPIKQIMRAGYVDNAYMLYDDARELNFTFAYDNFILELGLPTVEARRAAYLKVTPTDIQSAAQKIFTPDNLTLTVKGKRKRLDTSRLLKIVNQI